MARVSQATSDVSRDRRYYEGVLDAEVKAEEFHRWPNHNRGHGGPGAVRTLVTTMQPVVSGAYVQVHAHVMHASLGSLHLSPPLSTSLHLSPPLSTCTLEHAHVSPSTRLRSSPPPPHRHRHRRCPRTRVQVHLVQRGAENTSGTLAVEDFEAVSASR